MAGKVLVLDVDARDLCRALEADGVVADDECRVDLAEGALERAAEVGDLEADGRVNGVESPSTGRGDCQNLGYAHLNLLVWCIIEYSRTLAHRTCARKY